MLQKLHFIGLTSYDPVPCPQFRHINRQQVKSLPHLLPPTECWTAMNPDAIKASIYLIQLSSSSQIPVYNGPQPVQFHYLSRECVQTSEFTLNIRARMNSKSHQNSNLASGILKGPSRFGDKLTTCTMLKKNIQNYYSFTKNLRRSPHPPGLKDETSLDIRRVPTWLSFNPGKRHLQYCCICLFLI